MVEKWFHTEVWSQDSLDSGMTLPLCVGLMTPHRGIVSLGELFDTIRTFVRGLMTTYAGTCSSW